MNELIYSLNSSRIDLKNFRWNPTNFFSKNDDNIVFEKFHDKRKAMFHELEK